MNKDMSEHERRWRIPPASARLVPDKNWHQARQESLSFGERAADVMRNGMGSWGFVLAFVAFMIAWATVNSIGSGWDPYPYILLNLFLSMLAGLQGAILLIAAKRQDAVTAELAQHDYDTNVAAKQDVETLLHITTKQLALITEMHDDLRSRLESLERRTSAGAP
ncbi:hypothetical protein GCM10027053_35730 [Intrasporangium mesophilum]